MMISTEALRLAVFVVRHDSPSCLACVTDRGVHLEATCWRHDNVGNWDTEHTVLQATLRAVHAYLDY